MHFKPIDVFLQDIGNVNITLLLFTYLGAFCTHIFSLYSKDFQGLKPFLQSVLPSRSDQFYARINFLVLPVLGAVLGRVLIQPSNITASISAGLAWHTALTSALKRGQGLVTNPNRAAGQHAAGNGGTPGQNKEEGNEEKEEH